VYNDWCAQDDVYSSCARISVCKLVTFRRTHSLLPLFFKSACKYTPGTSKIVTSRPSYASIRSVVMIDSKDDVGYATNLSCPRYFLCPLGTVCVHSTFYISISLFLNEIYRSQRFFFSREDRDLVSVGVTTRLPGLAPSSSCLNSLNMAVMVVLPNFQIPALADIRVNITLYGISIYVLLSLFVVTLLGHFFPFVRRVNSLFKLYDFPLKPTCRHSIPTPAFILLGLVSLSFFLRLLHQLHRLRCLC